MNSIKQRIREINSRMGWSRFHNPKNLSMALIVEAAELCELLQWRDSFDRSFSLDDLDEMADEVADIFIYLIMFCESINIDLIGRTHKKLDKNVSRFVSAPESPANKIHEYVVCR